MPRGDVELSETQRRRNAATVCGWCQGPIQIKAAGRIPKWCSPACRQRNWEQSRAAASGRIYPRICATLLAPSDPLFRQRLNPLVQTLLGRDDFGLWHIIGERGMLAEWMPRWC